MVVVIASCATAVMCLLVMIRFFCLYRSLRITIKTSLNRLEESWQKTHRLVQALMIIVSDDPELEKKLKEVLDSKGGKP